MDAASSDNCACRSAYVERHGWSLPLVQTAGFAWQAGCREHACLQCRKAITVGKEPPQSILQCRKAITVDKAVRVYKPSQCKVITVDKAGPVRKPSQSIKCHPS